VADPAIILVSMQHAGVLLEEFQRRYQRDYDLRTAASCTEAEAVARDICDRGDQVALFVTDSRLPDVDHIYQAFHRWRLVVPTARRVVTAHCQPEVVTAKIVSPTQAALTMAIRDFLDRMGMQNQIRHPATSRWTGRLPRPGARPGDRGHGLVGLHRRWAAAA
jgi:thioredoxin reductase (NADPH)